MTTTGEPSESLDALYRFNISPLPSKSMSRIFDELHIYLNKDGSPTELAVRLYRALREFHEDRYYHHEGRLDLNYRSDPAHVDEVFHNFLRINGKALFGEQSQNKRIPVYRDTMSDAEILEYFLPVRSALLFLSRQWRVLQKKSEKEEVSHHQPRGSSLLPRSQAQNLELENFNNKDVSPNAKTPFSDSSSLFSFQSARIPQTLQEDEDTTTKAIKRQLSSSGRYNDEYPLWANGNSRHHHLARQILFDPSTVYPLGRGCTDCRRRGRVCSVRFGYAQCASCTAQGTNFCSGVSNAVGFSERGNLDNDIQSPRTPKPRQAKKSSFQDRSQNFRLQNKFRRHILGLEFDDSQEKSDTTSVFSETPRSHVPETPETSMPEVDFSNITPVSIDKQLFTNSNSSKRTMITLDEEDIPLRFLSAKRADCKITRAASDSGNQNSSAFELSTQSTSLKPPTIRAAVRLCILNNRYQWTEWLHGKLSQHNISSLFNRVAESYGIQNCLDLEKVEFRLIDSKPERVLVLHQDTTADLEKAMDDIKGLIRAQTFQGDFRVCMLPIIAANDKEDIDM